MKTYIECSECGTALRTAHRDPQVNEMGDVEYITLSVHPCKCIEQRIQAVRELYQTKAGEK